MVKELIGLWINVPNGNKVNKENLREEASNSIVTEGRLEIPPRSKILGDDGRVTVDSPDNFGITIELEGNDGQEVLEKLTKIREMLESEMKLSSDLATISYRGPEGFVFEKATISDVRPEGLIISSGDRRRL